MSVLVELLKSKYGVEQAQILAEGFIAQLQGAMILRNLFKDDENIRRQACYLLSLLMEDKKSVEIEKAES